jgi:molybdate transport system substrate-binding protein
MCAAVSQPAVYRAGDQDQARQCERERSAWHIEKIQRQGCDRRSKDADRREQLKPFAMAQGEQRGLLLLYDDPPYIRLDIAQPNPRTKPMPDSRSLTLRWITSLLLLIAQPFAFSIARAEPGDVVVFAAASLKSVLDEISTQWQTESGKHTTISYAASSALAKQIENGAPADIFISADLDWMDYLAKKDLIKAASRSNLLGNRLVLIAPQDSTAKIEIVPNFELARLLGDGRLALADTNAVPAGKYAKSALEKLGVWTSVHDKIAQAENVRAALILVARQEAPLGIVYQTDAISEPKVKVLATFPTDSHPPIIYPAAQLATSTNADAAAFLVYLKSAKAKALFEKQGFSVLP